MGTRYPDKEVIPIHQYCKDSMIFKSVSCMREGMPARWNGTVLFDTPGKRRGYCWKWVWERNPLGNHEEAGLLSRQQGEDGEERGTERNRNERDICKEMSHAMHQ